MGTTLAELAELVGGKLVGDGALTLTGAATIRDAVAGEITLLDRAELLGQLATSNAVATIAPADVAGVQLPHIQVKDVAAAFATVVNHFRPRRQLRSVGISPAAYLAPSVRLGENVEIHPGVTLGDDVRVGAGSILHAGVHVMAGCRIGANVTIFPGVVLYEDTVVGDRAILHANAVLGAYGFGYDTREGRHQLSAQLGNVVVEEDVEIGAGSTIDRGTYGPTLIGAGTKIDDQVMIAHNCRIGRHNLICSQVGIAGSTTTGEYVVMAGQVGVRDHVHIGKGAVLCAKAGVSSDIPAGETWLGAPAQPEHLHKRVLFAFHRLPEMRKQLKAMERLASQLAPPPAAPGDAAEATRTQQDAA